MASKAQSDTGSIAGARASNAGDVFHELWALRAALGLLVPGTPLTAVSVEGVSRETPTNFQYDGVDCGLFYGGATLEKADRVELLQLKYSTSERNLLAQWMDLAGADYPEPPIL